MAPRASAMLLRMCAGVAVLLAACSPALAVVGLTPMGVDVYARPGIPQEFEVAVTNMTQTERTVRLIAADVRIDENGDAQIAEDDPTEESTGGFDSQPTRQAPRANALVSFEGGSTVLLGPGEQRQVVCYATLPLGSTTEHLAWILVDPGPEEMPVYGNSNMRINVTFRIGARVLIVPGDRRERIDADGNTVVTLEPWFRQTYAVQLAEVREVIPPTDAEEPVLRVEGVLQNQGNTYITPLIQAQLRNLTTRRIVEEAVLPHGFNFVMGGTVRRFGGEFESPLEPGDYEVTVEVDLGDGRARTRQKTTFTLTEPIQGRERASQGVIGLDHAGQRATVRPGERSAGRAEVTNNFGETLRITPNAGSSSYADWFTFSPKSFVLHPGRTRSVRIAIRAPRDASQDLREVPVAFVPTTINGSTFAEGEAQTLTVTLRVLAPKTAATRTPR